MTHPIPESLSLHPRATAARPWRLLALMLLAPALVWSFLGTVGKPTCQDMDFGAYYRAGCAVACGQTPYTIDHHGPLGVYPYAPAYAYCFLPLSWLDYLWACRVWMVLNWLAAVAALALAVRLALGPGYRREAAWPVALLAAVATSAYLWANLRAGQVGMLMLLGCLAWADCARRGRSFLGGLCLAGACGLKLAPGLLLPYLLLRRDWLGLAGVAVGGLALFLLPAAWVGLSGTVQLHQEWIRHTAATHVPEQTYRPGNQSLLAQLARLPSVSNGHVCHSAANLDALYQAYPFLVLTLAALVLVWVARGLRRPREEGQALDNLHLAVLLVFLTLAHPRGWRCNLVALIFPCALLAAHAWRRLPAAGVALAALALPVLAGAWPTAGVGHGDWTPGAWLLLGKHFWGAVAVTAACCWCATRARGADCPS
ncbi:MAG: DUF2029 domain-containing protein [Gemmataceae bacterium]|nr:DUF2029 domain-containing protein [Gemmataceae bacterium]